MPVPAPPGVTSVNDKPANVEPRCLVLARLNKTTGEGKCLVLSVFWSAALQRRFWRPPKRGAEAPHSKKAAHPGHGPLAAFPLACGYLDSGGFPCPHGLHPTPTAIPTASSPYLPTTCWPRCRPTPVTWRVAWPLIPCRPVPLA